MMKKNQMMQYMIKIIKMSKGHLKDQVQRSYLINLIHNPILITIQFM